MNETTTWPEDVVKGIDTIAGGGSVGGLQFTPEVKAAIAAGLAIDADPYFAMSDMCIGRSAALTPKGLQVARELGLLTSCACGVCNRETNPNVSRYCNMCRVSGNRQGWYNGTQCYGCYLVSHPAVAEARKAMLDSVSVTRMRRGRNPTAQRLWDEYCIYSDPADQIVKDFR